MSTNIRTHIHTHTHSLSLSLLFPLPSSRPNRFSLPLSRFTYPPYPVLLFPLFFPRLPPSRSTTRSLSLCQPRMGNLKYESVYLALGIPVDIDDKILLQLHPSPSPLHQPLLHSSVDRRCRDNCNHPRRSGFANNAADICTYITGSRALTETEFEFQRQKKKTRHCDSAKSQHCIPARR